MPWIWPFDLPERKGNIEYKEDLWINAAGVDRHEIAIK